MKNGNNWMRTLFRKTGHRTRKTCKQESEMSIKLFRTLLNSKEHLRLFLIQLLTKICWTWSYNNWIDTRRDKKACCMTFRNWKSKYKRPRRAFFQWKSNLKVWRLKCCKEECRIRRSLYQNVKRSWLWYKTTWTSWNHQLKKVWAN